MRIRVGHLYPEYLNIYADRGNIAVLARRAALRGHELAVTSVSVGDAGRAGRIRPLLRRRRAGPRAGADRARPRRQGPCDRDAVAGGAALLAVCGGYQLLGRGYLGRHGDSMPGIGLFPHETVAGDKRMIGDVLLELRLGRGGRWPGSRTTPVERGSTPVPSRSDASSPASGTTASRVTRASASAVPSGRTCTGRCCPVTRGSPTGCSPRRLRTRRTASRPSWSRSPIVSRPRRTRCRPSGRETAAAVSRA